MGVPSHLATINAAKCRPWHANDMPASQMSTLACQNVDHGMPTTCQDSENVDRGMPMTCQASQNVDHGMSRTCQ
ncbi:hypothetical protein DVH24_033641 [Malus domestica]|uniref:Uncharacterized protein n=1 Tax=Malus domestica TaxID=3750 RepID=A0A498KXB6_MALDO|nr:hypothetical protein DVH24_033641 [Malus domestica]